MPSSPAFQFYPNDFLGSAVVAAMTDAEVGVYVRLLCYDWDGGGLPADHDVLARMLKMPARKFEAAWAAVGRCFVERDGRLYNPRLETEREKQRIWREKSAKGGRKSGEARAKGGSTVVQPHHEPNGNTPFPSPTPVTTTTKTCDAAASRPVARRKKTDPPPASSRASWLTPVSAAWEQSKGAGTFPWGKAGAVLKPLNDAGHTGDEIGGNLGRYLAKTESRFVSLPRFAETFADWAKCDLPLVDEWGCLTEYGERVTRPDGMRGAA